MPKRVFRAIATSGFVLALVACGGSGERLAHGLVPPAADTVARATITAVARGDTAAVRRVLLVGATPPPGLADSLFALRAYFASDQPDSLRLVAAEVLRSRGVRYTRAVYAVYTSAAHGTAGGRWAAVEVDLAQELGVTVVTGIHARAIPDAPERAGALGAPDGLTQWLAALAALAVAAYTVMSAVRIARTPMPKRGWWAACALVGVGRFGVNWSTGDLVVQPITLQLLGVGAERPGVTAPWFVFVSLPIGAWLALRTRRRALHADGGSAGPASPTAAVIPADV